MSSSLRNSLRAGICALALGAAATGGAQATEGYFVEGVSARDQALGGAGMANPTEALTIANNPAGPCRCRSPIQRRSFTVQSEPAI